MKLLQLTIKNFRSFKKETFTFPDAGLYFLYGDNQAEPRLGANAAGKSTIWDALCWVFWGKTLRGLKAGDVANWDVGGDVSVSLRYEFEDLTYLVTRTWKPNSWVMIAPLQTLDLVEDETNLLWSHLKLSYLAATHSIFMAQQQPMFLDLAAKDKSTLFSEVMGLDKWLEYSDRAGKQATIQINLATELEKEIANIDGKIAGLKAVDFENDRVIWEKTRKARLDSLEQEYTGYLTKAKDIKLAISSELAKTSILERALSKLDKSVKHCPTCNQKINNTEYSELLRDIQQHQQLGNFKKRDLAQYERRIDSIELEVVDVEKERNPLQDKKNVLDAEVKVLVGRKLGCLSWLDEVKSNQRLYSYWVQGFKDLRLRLIGEALQQLEIETNSSLMELGLIGWELRFTIDRETKSGSFQRGFNVMVQSPSNKQQVPFEVWSGGESQRLRLAAQMGLSNLIRSTSGTTLNLEVWDEPSQFISAGGVEDLLDSLRNRATQEKRQVWVVDHRTLGYSDFDNIITVCKNLDGSYIK